MHAGSERGSYIIIVIIYFTLIRVHELHGRINLFANIYIY